MGGLSEKAKGKQRAVEVAVRDDTKPAGPQFRELIIRFTNAIPDLTIKIEAKDAVRDVKRQIKQEQPDLARRRLRLIHAGRLLPDGTYLFQALQSQEERQNRALNTKEDGLNPLVNDESSPPAPTWLHCSVGAEMTGGEAEAEDLKAQIAQLKPLRGFDRLATAGFSEDDIAAFRRTFHSQSNGDFLDDETPTNDEEYDEHARALEEQWIDSLDNVGTSSVTRSSTSTEIMQGLLIGFFFPLLPFFFLREMPSAIFWEDGHEQRRSRNSVFPPRTQMALVLGFLVNITFGMWRYLLTS